KTAASYSRCQAGYRTGRTRVYLCHTSLLCRKGCFAQQTVAPGWARRGGWYLPSIRLKQEASKKTMASASAEGCAPVLTRTPAQVTSHLRAPRLRARAQNTMHFVKSLDRLREILESHGATGEIECSSGIADAFHTRKSILVASQVQGGSTGDAGFR